MLKIHKPLGSRMNSHPSAWEIEVWKSFDCNGFLNQSAGPSQKTSKCWACSESRYLDFGGREYVPIDSRRFQFEQQNGGQTKISYNFFAELEPR